MSIYKITFKYAPFAAAKVKYVTADDVDCYTETATFSNRISLPDDPNPPFGITGSNYRVQVIASYKDWQSVEIVDSIPFTSSQTGDSSEDI